MEIAIKKRLAIGILGGMRSAAMVNIFGRIIKTAPAACNEEHLNIQNDNTNVITLAVGTSMALGCEMLDATA